MSTDSTSVWMVRRVARMVRQRARAGRLLPLLAVVNTLAAAPGDVSGAQQNPPPRALVQRAVDLMGGEARLRAVEQVTLRMMTQWQRTSFRQVPYVDRPSYESHFDVRSYTQNAWRNTRELGTRTIVNIIDDSVAVTNFGNGFQPLSAAYVDERDELFTYTPDRMVLALLDAGELSAVRDTLIGDERHFAVEAILSDVYPSTVYFHAGTGLPTLLRFRAGHPADFGLVPWGVMDVEVWYSSWRSFGEISIPVQWDVVRVGRPYKRLTVQQADFAPAFAAADSFTISEALRGDYWASTAPRPMHEGVEVPTPTLPAEGVVEIGGFALPNGAVRTGRGWMMLGAGQAPFNYEQAVQLLAGAGADSIQSVLIGQGRTGNGGVTRAAANGLPIYVSPAAEPFVRTILANAGESDATVVSIAGGLDLGQGDQRVVLETVDLPDVPGSLLLYRPATGWLYAPDAQDPLDERVARARAAELGWEVRSVGTARGFGISDGS